MQKVKIADEEIVLDPKHLEVDEVTLNDFLKQFAGIYNHYNMIWAKAQFIQRTADDRADFIQADRYRFFKENEGGSDKLAEAKAKIHEDVVAAKRDAQNARYVSHVLNLYLRALDKAHEDALNLGYNIRKEMDKLYPNCIKESVDDEMAKLMQDTIV